MEYNVKLSKGKININGKEYDIPDEVAEFIIYETSTRDDIIQTRDVYKRTIDKAIEFINECMRDEDDDTDKLKLLQRIASETEVKASRIPQPLNITEVGGYFNLIDQVDADNAALKAKKNEMQLSLIASALGLPV